jgi:hypothetical protein
MNFLDGFEKWVNTLSMKFASWAFAFDAILESFTARQPPCPVCYLQVGILPKTAGGCRAFFARQTSRIKKWVNSSR